MKKIAVIVCALSLYGCGNSSDISSASSLSPAPSTSVPDSSGVDPNTSLGKALVQIDSPSYQDQLVFSLQGEPPGTNPKLVAVDPLLLE
ncbi:MAG: hypothetical protein Q7T03_03115 [Deltaproteobacteria bacterium]|nr:hypothetical protein [Deltaproteobacteria bacterium]